MYPSKEFLKMSERFFQDLDLVASSEAELAKFVLGGLTDAEKERLRVFLSEIVSDRCSDEQLQELWAKTPAEVGFPEGLRKVLVPVRGHIT
jgi:hypothetical protein